MEFDLKNLPKSPELLEKIIVHLKNELTEAVPFKQKYFHLLEEIRLSKQKLFSPSSEKTNQNGLFDESGVELPEEVKEQLSVDVELRSYAGAKAGAILYSLIETCKANGIEPYKYFCTMLHRVRLCQSTDDYRKLLPQFIQL